LRILIPHSLKSVDLGMIIVDAQTQAAHQAPAAENALDQKAEA